MQTILFPTIGEAIEINKKQNEKYYNACTVIVMIDLQLSR